MGRNGHEQQNVDSADHAVESAVESASVTRVDRDRLISVYHPGDALWSLPPVLFPEHRLIYADPYRHDGRLATVLSSRLGRCYSRRTAWFEQLRCLLTRLTMANRTVVTCDGTTCDRYLRCVHPNLGFRLERCELPSEHQTFDEWMSLMSQGATRRLDRRFAELAVSPAKLPCVQHTRTPGDLPLADRLLTALGEDVYVLFVRPGGKLQKLVTHCLENSMTMSQQWFIAIGSDLVSPRIADPWIASGAMAWQTDPLLELSTNRSDISGRLRLSGLPTPPLVPIHDVSWDQYLAHWTRAQSGPWPDQAEADFVYSLLFDSSERDRSALASLRRILQMQRLIATNRLTRGDTHVVSFTERPLPQFASSRVFRPSHARWDFEPYGLCIDRRWLMHQGTRPVIYGDESTWQSLDIQHRSFFQPYGRSGDHEVAGGWANEREWRHIGDLDLRLVPPNKAIVFVPDSQSAAQIAALSTWPITVTGDGVAVRP